MTSPSIVLLNPRDWVGESVCLSGRIGSKGFRFVIYDEPQGSWSDQQALRSYRDGIVLRFPGLMRAMYAAYPVMYGTQVWEINRVCVNGVLRRSSADTHRWIIDDIQQIEFLEGSNCRKTAPRFITPEYVRQCQQDWIEMIKRDSRIMPDIAPAIAVAERDATAW